MHIQPAHPNPPSPGMPLNIRVLECATSLDKEKLAAEIVIKHYEAVRGELVARTPLHYQLIMFKFVSIGGMLTFLSPNLNQLKQFQGLSQSDLFFVYSLWMMVLIAMIFDEFIVRNFRLVSDTRDYIRAHLLPRFKPFVGEFTYWEDYMKVHASHKIVNVPLTVWFVWLVTCILFAMVFSLRYQSKLSYGDYAFALVLGGGCIRNFASIYTIKYWKRTSS